MNPTRKHSSATSAAPASSASDSLTLDAWDLALREADKGRAKIPPGKGWLKFEEIRARFGWGRVKTYDWLAANTRTIEVFFGSEPRADGGLVRRVWYRLKS